MSTGIQAIRELILRRKRGAGQMRETYDVANGDHWKGYRTAMSDVVDLLATIDRGDDTTRFTECVDLFHRSFIWGRRGTRTLDGGGTRVNLEEEEVPF